VEAQPPIYLRGLAPTASYQVDGFAGIRSGLAWMQIGIEIHLSDYQSTILRIHQVA
jgi:hypothetical protein